MRTHTLAIAAMLLAWGLSLPGAAQAAGDFHGLREVNPPADPDDNTPVALVGGLLIDGRGGPPVPDAVVILRGRQIEAVGPRDSTPIPDDARVHDVRGLSVLPGLIDTHFHNDTRRPTVLPALVLSRGITTLRDPGLPIADYVSLRQAKEPLPRCFLTGRHFDQEPHAYPHDAITIRTPDEARAAVDGHIQDGSSGIKVYFRLPIDLIRVTCDTSHARGIPVTAHLELVDADEAVRAGLDGVEHITSFGTALATPETADDFRQAVRNDNAARRDGRYRLWSTLDLDDNARVAPLVRLLADRGVVLSPTLAVFERQPGDRNVQDFHVQGFQNMLRFTGLCHKAGVPVVVGSHTSVPHAERGWAYHRELELLIASGLTPAEAIQAATLRGARALGCGDRLGSLEPGKRADLIVVDGDPTADINALRSVRHVLRNGQWIGEAPRLTSDAPK